MLLMSTIRWQLDVERGPEWLFIKVRQPADLNDTLDVSGLADAIWELAQSHFCYRVVLEMEQVDLLFSSFLGQLILLSKRIHSHHGVLRISGLSAVNQEVLHTCRLDAALPNYECRGEAVLGQHPVLPR